MADGLGENESDVGPSDLKPVRGLNAAEDVVLQWDSSSSDHARQSMIWDCPQDEAVAYLEAVDEIQIALESLLVSQSNTRELSRVQNLRQLAMARLEEEFRHMLLAFSDTVDPDWLMENCSRAGSFSSRRLDDGGVDEVAESRSSGEEDGAEDEVPVARPVEMKPLLDLIPPGIVPDLADIAQRMLRAGYRRECMQVYASIRKNALEETLKRLGVERQSTEEVGKMRWEDQEVKIKKWNQSMKLSVRALFPSERRLCEDVFGDDSGPVVESCFAELAKGPMMLLLSFGEAVAISRRSPEKLFKILDMYETLRDLLPELEEIFSGEPSVSVRAEASGILMRLGECARGTFADFESAIQREDTRTPVPGGGVHPLTRYVMNYIKFMCDFSDTLKLLFGEKKKDSEAEGEDSAESLRDSPRYSSRLSDDRDRDGNSAELSSLGVQTIWITKVLLSNLEEKSKVYKDLSLTYLFLMNNIHYMVLKVKTTEVRAVVGDDWVRKNTSQVRQYASSYQRAAWSKVLTCLRDEGIHTGGSFSSGVSKQVLKERFKSFNIAFDEAQKAQMSWVVFDEQLRDELRISISDKILPAYRSFLGRYGPYLESQRHPERYIKYTSDDIEEYLNNLFEAPTPSNSSRDLRRRISNHGSSHGS